MTRTPSDVTVDSAQLGPMTKLGRGGQGTAFLLQSSLPIPGVHGDLVYKRYHRKILAKSSHSLASAMPQLILHPDSLADEDRARVRLYTVWPQGLVLDTGAAQGIIMKLVPDTFFFDLQLPGTGTGSRQLLELQYLMLPAARASARGVPAFSDEERVRFIKRTLEALAFLHRIGVVVGDFSPKNLLASNPDRVGSAGVRRFLPKFLDVDAFRFDAGVPPIRQFHTPSWFPPETRAAEHRLAALVQRGAPAFEIAQARAAAGVQTTRSDMFKMGLLALRLLHVPTDPAEDDTQSVYVSSSADSTMRRLFGERIAKVLRSMLSADPADRPTAAEALAVFTDG